jgi:hypothetical protein
VVSPRITAQSLVNFACVYIDVFVTFTDCFLHYPIKLIAKIVGGQRHSGSNFSPCSNIADVGTLTTGPAANELLTCAEAKLTLNDVSGYFAVVDVNTGFALMWPYKTVLYCTYKNSHFP